MSPRSAEAQKWAKPTNQRVQKKIETAIGECSSEKEKQCNTGKAVELTIMRVEMCEKYPYQD